MDGKIALGAQLEATDFFFDKHDTLVSDKPVNMCPEPNGPGFVFGELVIFWGEKPGKECKEINLVGENTSDNNMVW